MEVIDIDKLVNFNTANREKLIGNRANFVTSAGLFNGSVYDINEDCTAIELRDVEFSPFNNIEKPINIKACELYSTQIVASFPIGERIQFPQ